MEGENIHSYTSTEAVADGFLVEVVVFNQGWEKGLFNYITTGLLESKGYIQSGYEFNLPNIMDLLNQANQIVRKESNDFKDFDYFFSGEIELPSGAREVINIQQNETGKFTIMLPSER